MSVLTDRARSLLSRVGPGDIKQKHTAELAYWKESLANLEDWYVRGANLRIGLRSPAPEQRVDKSDSWIVNAVMTMHSMRPHYTERLQIDRQQLRGLRVLEIGSGPLAPVLQFPDCQRHCVDPLVDVYMAAGWPLYDYDAKFINTGGESLPYQNSYFDAAISVNALDHVDDFERCALEMERVVRPGGKLYFEVEYHEPTVTEPLKLSDAHVRRAFRRTELTTVISRSGKQLYDALVKRFDLLPYDFPHFDARFSTWHGTRT